MQIVNRDLSIAVLRAFQKKRQEEFLNERRRKAEVKQKSKNEANDGQPATRDVTTHVPDQEEHEKSVNGSNPEISKPVEIKPMRILEAWI